MSRRTLAVLVTAAALTAPAMPVSAAAAPTEVIAAPAHVKPAKQAAKRQWRGYVRVQRQYHCRAFRQDRALYGAGFRTAAQLNGKSPRRARALWLGWKWQLNRKCP